MDAEMLEMLETSLERVLTAPSDQPLSARLDELGWDEVLADDTPTALRTLFTVKGATLSPSDALGPILASAIADALGATDLVDATIALPMSLHPARPSSRVDRDDLELRGVVLAAPPDGARVVFPVDDGAGGVELVVVENDGRLSSRPVGQLDPDLGLRTVAARVGAATATRLGGSAAADAWDVGVGLGRWLLAAELCGIADHVVSGAVAYACERHQYGRAIGSFQAVQHRLAAAHASVVGASGVVAEAAASGSPWVATVAKALAGRATEDACTQAQQVYGAIGFTWEHELHRFLRRTYVLDRLLGDWRTLEHEIGAHLQATRDVPRIGAL